MFLVHRKILHMESRLGSEGFYCKFDMYALDLIDGRESEGTVTQWSLLQHSVKAIHPFLT